MKILGIETSCDDTSVALVEDTGFVHQQVSANQDLIHSRFGGIVPELASRNHSLFLLPLIDQIINGDSSRFDAISVTSRPGLVGSLIVGVVTAKALALSYQKPIIGVNHLEGHILAPFLYDDKNAKLELQFPYIALAVSGGHTSIYLVHGLGEYDILGASLDDAAGESFDKFGKLIGLGFPGGVQVDRLSQGGNANAFSFPRALIKEENLQMSFSGLKSASGRLWAELCEKYDVDARQAMLPDLCASFQEAVVDVLLSKLSFAAREKGLKNIVITGGVSANSRLRERAQALAKKNNWNVFIPPLKYCTDNAAMIAYAGGQRLLRGEKSDMSLSPSPRPNDGDFREGTMKKGRQSRVKSP
jgi:N6-L-threonylcarbamoyladenine synthase